MYNIKKIAQKKIVQQKKKVIGDIFKKCMI